MEGKTLVLSVLVMSLFIAQINAKSCCPSTTARNIYNTCRFAGSPRPVCASLSGCKNISGTKCPNGYTHDTLENTGNTVDAYCKLGCVSSVCGGLTTLQNSDASEIVSGAVEKCANACSTVCTKGSVNAVEIA
ncbi:hypothetical protein CARUB_v10024304mg [Capsella rubella]|uniref:Acidic protein n=1 Tax=Capsella rubella TaxID=81985 RepID=R0HES6_9BRAS|nr:probable thionin-2.4 [Capsella rubella]EOA28119.1 hypothetical protein CARUB_v10024304mg [Capsella rubella]